MGVLLSRPEDIMTFGRNEAALLGQLHYWLNKANGGHNNHVVRRDGYAWVAKSREAWCQETMLTQQQLRTALEKLKKLKVIVVKRHLFENRVTAHIRIDEDERQTQISMVQETQTSMGPQTQINMGHQTQIIYNETIVENKKDYSADFVDGNFEEEPMPPKSRIGLSVADVLSGKKTTVEKLVTPDKATKVGDLALIFQKAWADKYPDTFLPTLTGTQMGQLKHLLTRSPKGKAGVVLDYVTRHWQDFCGYAVARQAAFKLADRPSIPQILQYLQSAVETWQEAQIKPSTAPKYVAPPPTPIEAKKTSPKAVIEDEDKPITLEELQKMMGLSGD